MDSEPSAEHETSPELAELRYLRARVAELEAELVKVEEWAGRAVAEAQEKTYWLDRWHVDLNAVMRQRWTGQVRAGLRAVRAVVRKWRRFRRQYMS